MGAQFALLGAIALAPGGAIVLDGAALDGVGIAALAAGVALVGWAAWALGRGLTPLPAPRPGGALVTHGPYRLTRHPMYVGVALGASGLGVIRGGILTLGLVAALAAVLLIKSRHEEAFLRCAYPGYERYAGRRRRAAGER